MLAFGACLKNTVCVTRGDEAFLSQHIGDLDNAATCRALDETVAHLLALLDVEPEAVAHDLHPDFYSTRFALGFAARTRRCPRSPCSTTTRTSPPSPPSIASHGPLLGLALDGVGLGSDGGAWGGELLRVDGAPCARLGHLRAAALPGGDRAAREPWRMAAAALHALGRAEQIAARFAAQPGAGTVAQMLARGLHCPRTSSMGRWFDAAAALLGVRADQCLRGPGGDAARRRWPPAAARRGRSPISATSWRRSRRHARPVAAARAPGRRGRRAHGRGAVSPRLADGAGRLGRRRPQNRPACAPSRSAAAAS